MTDPASRPETATASSSGSFASTPPAHGPRGIGPRPVYGPPISAIPRRHRRSRRRSHRWSGVHPHSATGTAGFGRHDFGLRVGEQPETGAAHGFDGGHPKWDIDLAPQIADVDLDD